jgi:hypothetical protein
LTTVDARINFLLVCRLLRLWRSHFLMPDRKNSHSMPCTCLKFTTLFSFFYRIMARFPTFPLF